MENQTASSFEDLAVLIFWGVIVYLFVKWRKKKKLQKQNSIKDNIEKIIGDEVKSNLANYTMNIQTSDVNIPPMKLIIPKPPDLLRNKENYENAACPSCGTLIDKLPKQNGTCKSCKEKYYIATHPYGYEVLFGKEEKEIFYSELNNIQKYDWLSSLSDYFTSQEIKKIEKSHNPVKMVIDIFTSKASNAEGSKGGYYWNMVWKVSDKFDMEERLPAFLVGVWLNIAGHGIHHILEFHLKKYEELRSIYNKTDEEMKEIFIDMALANPFRYMKHVHRKLRRYSPETAWNLYFKNITQARKL